jgi:hypothetical protein
LPSPSFFAKEVTAARVLDDVFSELAVGMKYLLSMLIRNPLSGNFLKRAKQKN